MIEQARHELAEFMEQSGKTQAQIARETSLSTATVSQFLNGTYNGDNEKTAAALIKYLKVAQEQIRQTTTETFYRDLRNTVISMGAADYAHKKREIVLLSGAAGAGKTTALKHYVEETTGVIFITANSCMTSASAILGAITEKIGRTPKSKKQLLMKELVNALQGSNRLIIIDEADHLTFSALQALRNLNDEAGVGILLAGNDRIYNQMVCGVKSSEFDQLRTRIFARPKVCNEYTIDEIKGIFGIDDLDSVKLLLEVAQAQSLRNARKMYNAAVELARMKKQPLRAAHLNTIRKQFLCNV